MSRIDIFDGAKQKKIQGKLSEWSEEIVSEEIEGFVTDKAQIYRAGDDVRFTKEAARVLRKMKIRTKQVKDIEMPEEKGATQRVCVLIQYGSDRGAKLWGLSYNPEKERDRFNPQKTEVNCFDAEVCINNVWERHDDGTKTFRLIQAKEMGYDTIESATKHERRMFEEEVQHRDYLGEFSNEGDE